MKIISKQQATKIGGGVLPLIAATGAAVLSWANVWRVATSKK